MFGSVGRASVSTRGGGVQFRGQLSWDRGEDSGTQLDFTHTDHQLTTMSPVNRRISFRYNSSKQSKGRGRKGEGVCWMGKAAPG